MTGLPFRGGSRRHRASFVVVVTVTVVVALMLLPTAPPAPAASRPTVPLRSDSNPATSTGTLAALPATVKPAVAASGQWVNVTAGLALQPSPRAYAAVAWDGKDQEYLLFGGESNGAILGDTWAYHEGVWTRIHSKLNPPGRYGAGLIFDPVDNYTILFGGNNTTGPVGGTWEFVAGAWTRVNLTTSWAGRSFPAMAFDPTAGMVVLFGGFAALNVSAPTRGYAKGDWTTIESNLKTPYPADAAGASMAYDVATGQLVLFGGQDLSSPSLTDLNTTWELKWTGTPDNGTGYWIKISAPVAPSPRFDAALAYDESDGVLVLFGGESASGALLSDTWTWNGTEWSNVSNIVAGPGPRIGAGFAPAPEPGEAATAVSPLFLFGGDGTSGTYLGDSWYFGNLTFAALPPRPAAPGVDVGVPQQLSVLAFGEDSGPYSYNWTLPNGCSGGNESHVTCTLRSPSLPSATVTVTDVTGLSVTVGPSSWYVNGTPKISGLTFGPPTVVGLPMDIVTNLTSRTGTPPFSLQFSGLPPGCNGHSNNFYCTPTTAGKYTVNLTLTDADGRTTNFSTYVQISPATQPNTAPEDYVLGVLGVLGLLAVAGIIIWIARRRRRSPPAASELSSASPRTESSPDNPAPRSAPPPPTSPPSTGDR